MNRIRYSFSFCLVIAILSTALLTAETFHNPIRIPVNSDPIGVFVVDLNNDRLPDILWGGYGATQAGPGIVHTLLRQASGSYLPGPKLDLPANVSSVCLPADETGDGIADIVCPSAHQLTSSIYTFPGKGDGSFGTPVITPIQSLPNNGSFAAPRFHLLSDLNADGVPDLIVIDAGSGSGFVMLGNGHGAFTKSDVIGGYGDPQAIDVNGDGKVDIAFSSGVVWLGRGNGTFRQLGSTVPNFATCVLHDMDSDGKPDAVCGVFETINGDITGGTQLQILQGNGDGTFGPTPIKIVSYGDHTNEYNGYGTFNTPVAVMDLNADGVPDILANAGDGLTVILGHPQLAFDPPTHYATGYPPDGLSGEHGMQIADIDNDGIPDLVSIGPNGIYVTYGIKDGTLDTASAYELGQLIGYQTVADFNEDGFPDVASTGNLSLELSLGKGDGSLPTPIPLPFGGIDFSTPPSPTSARILHGDFNGDHHQDILAVGSSGIYQNNTYVLFGDGSGAFATPLLVPSSSAISNAFMSLLAQDIDRDGRDDLFSNDNSNLYASLSNGDGSFTTVTTAVGPNTIQNPNGTPSLAVLADFDNDGNLDTAWAAGSNVTVVKGNGDGSFQSAALSLPIPTTAFSSWAEAVVTTGDFDGDGNLDLALLIDRVSPMYGEIPGPVDSAVFVFYGKGDGTFTSALQAGAFNRPYSGIYSADLNNEGLADLILKTSGSLGGGYTIAIVDSLPNRTFGPEVNYFAGTGLADISIADIDNDGFNDLLFSNGDYNIRASSATVLLNQGNPPVTGTIAITPEPSIYSQPLTINATFVPSSFTPLTGTATFNMDGEPVGSSPISENAASVSPSVVIPSGSHAVTVTWPGNSIYSSITLSATHKIQPVSSSVTLSSDLNPAPLGGRVTFTASTAADVPVGVDTDTVTFFDGSTQLAPAIPVAIGQTATFATSSLSIGSHSITAVYSGNSNILGSTSSPLTESIPYFVGDFSIQATPAAATVTAGQSAAFQIGVTPTGGFSAPMSFSCSGLPTHSSCNWDTTGPSGQGKFALGIQTAGPRKSSFLRPFSNPLETTCCSTALAALVFCLLPTRSRRKRFIRYFMLVLLSIATLSTTSCGGGGTGGTGGTDNSTPAGRYQITVTAQTTEPAQNITRSCSIALTVQ